MSERQLHEDGLMNGLSFRTPVHTGLLICVLALVSGLTGCDTTEQEQQIQGVVEQSVRAIEDRDVKQIFKLTTSEVVVHPGKMNRASLVRRLHFWLRANPSMEILHPAAEIDVDSSGETALVSLPIAATRPGHIPNDLEELDDHEAWAAQLHNRAQIFHFELSLVKNDESWLIDSIRIQ